MVVFTGLVLISFNFCICITFNKPIKVYANHKEHCLKLSIIISFNWLYTYVNTHINISIEFVMKTNW